MCRVLWSLTFLAKNKWRCVALVGRVAGYYYRSFSYSSAVCTDARRYGREWHVLSRQHIYYLVVAHRGSHMTRLEPSLRPPRANREPRTGSQTESSHRRHRSIDKALATCAKLCHATTLAHLRPCPCRPVALAEGPCGTPSLAEAKRPGAALLQPCQSALHATSRSRAR
eukprot:875761-Prymnesium_polylepis.2